MNVRSHSRVLPYLALITGILALSFSSLFVRWAKAPGTVTSFYRMLIAALVLTPLALRQKPFQGKLDHRVFYLPLLGGFFTALDHAVWSTAIGYTKVANATLLNNLAPIWVALVAWILFREHLKPVFWLGLLFTMTGATVVLGNDLIHEPGLSRGDLLGVTSSIFYAGYFLITQRGRQRFNTLTYVWMICSVSAGVLLLINLGRGLPLTGYSTPTYLAFLGSALISQIIGYFSVGYALGHLPASLVAPTMIAQPVLTALLAIPLVGEQLQTGQWIGGIAVLTGIYLVNHSRSGEEQPAIQTPIDVSLV